MNRSTPFDNHWARSTRGNVNRIDRPSASAKSSSSASPTTTNTATPSGAAFTNAKHAKGGNDTETVDSFPPEFNIHMDETCGFCFRNPIIGKRGYLGSRNVMCCGRCSDGSTSSYEAAGKSIANDILCSNLRICFDIVITLPRLFNARKGVQQKCCIYPQDWQWWRWQVPPLLVSHPPTSNEKTLISIRCYCSMLNLLNCISPTPTR